MEGTLLNWPRSYKHVLLRRKREKESTSWNSLDQGSCLHLTRKVNWCGRELIMIIQECTFRRKERKKVHLEFTWSELTPPSYPKGKLVWRGHSLIDQDHSSIVLLEEYDWARSLNLSKRHFAIKISRNKVNNWFQITWFKSTAAVIYIFFQICDQLKTWSKAVY